MKDLLITIHNGGDEAVAAVQRIGEDWRLQLEAAAAEVERLRGDLEVMRLQRDAARGSLTDAEREVIQWAANAMRPECRATLRGLLERLK